MSEVEEKVEVAEEKKYTVVNDNSKGQREQVRVTSWKNDIIAEAKNFEYERVTRDEVAAGKYPDELVNKFKRYDNDGKEITGTMVDGKAAGNRKIREFQYEVTNKNTGEKKMISPRATLILTAGEPGTRDGKIQASIPRQWIETRADVEAKLAKAKEERMNGKDKDTESQKEYVLKEKLKKIGRDGKKILVNVPEGKPIPVAKLEFIRDEDGKLTKDYRTVLGNTNADNLEKALSGKPFSFTRNGKVVYPKKSRENTTEIGEVKRTQEIAKDARGL